MRLQWLALLLPAAVHGAGLAPYAPECEARRNPVGIETARPRFSWKLRAVESGQTQTAWQIVVDGAWDSGRVNSAETAWVPYAGAALRPLDRYTWKVRVWDASGQPSEWSEPAECTTAPLDPAEWRAAWISSPDRSLRS